MRLRTMTESDIPAGMRLKEIAGWNQTRADWTRFLQASPGGCFAAEADGSVCGTAATISYENKFAWIGMVLVDPQYRGRGIGTKLLTRAVDHLIQQKIPTIKLDATPQGKPLYEKLGFVSEYEIARWTLQRQGDPARPKKASAKAIARPRMLPGLLNLICEADRQIFGADRSFLLKSIHKKARNLTAAIGDSAGLHGYSFVRQGSFADHLGPWVARDGPAASQLLQVFLTNSRRETLIVDCLKPRQETVELLKSHGFAYSRLLTRMYLGPNSFPGRPEALCSITGPEFG